LVGTGLAYTCKKEHVTSTVFTTIAESFGNLCFGNRWSNVCKKVMASITSRFVKLGKFHKK